MSWLIQAFTLGLALAWISALGRRRRMVRVFRVTVGVYHTLPEGAASFPDGAATRIGPALAALRWGAPVDRVTV